MPSASLNHRERELEVQLRTAVLGELKPEQHHRATLQEQYEQHQGKYISEAT